ncbi:DNA repair protein RecO [Candidatus Kaiserbacteria bacterium]|nr:DNA repair protein RecO [Candidatus Kaiserbacteria bacterium]
MHEKYITEGIVLGKRGVGEANTLVFVLTEQLGLVRAKATSARRESSKLRYGLETLSRGRYTFVRGKNEWRLTGADEVSRDYCSATPAQCKRLGQVSRLLLRLVLGAEHTPELYQTVRKGFESLAHTEHNADSVECVLVLRILAHLGYLPSLPTLAPFVETDAFTPELAAEAAASRKLLIKLINESLQATGL